MVIHKKCLILNQERFDHGTPGTARAVSTRAGGYSAVRRSWRNAGNLWMEENVCTIDFVHNLQA
jgi:hypothetical protein